MYFSFPPLRLPMCPPARHSSSGTPLPVREVALFLQQCVPGHQGNVVLGGARLGITFSLSLYGIYNNMENKMHLCISYLIYIPPSHPLTLCEPRHTVYIREKPMAHHETNKQKKL